MIFTNYGAYFRLPVIQKESAPGASIPPHSNAVKLPKSLPENAYGASVMRVHEPFSP